MIADGADVRDTRVRTSYDAIATAYADHLVDELPGLPFETWLLDRVIAEAAGRPVVEVGSGPGHVTAYLADGGADATGLDLSPEMVAEARRRFPGRNFEVGDLRRLSRPATSSGWAGVLGWYSLIHLAATELPDAVAALVRPLAPGGWLVLGLHAGPRSVTSTSGSAMRSSSTSCCTSRRSSSGSWRPPASSTWSGTSAGLSPPGVRRPSASTSSGADAQRAPTRLGEGL